MGLAQLLKRRGVRADALAADIAKVGDEVTRLQAEHDQAEAAAVAAVSDDKYSEAAAVAAAVKGRLDEATERLARMKRAHAEARQAEKDEYVARIEQRIAEEEAAGEQRRRDLEEQTQAEIRRHEEAMQSLKREGELNKGRAGPLKRELQLAEQGVPENRVEKIRALRAAFNQVNTECSELKSGLPDLIRRERYAEEQAAGNEYRHHLAAAESFGREHQNLQVERQALESRIAVIVAEKKRIEAEIAELSAVD